MSCWWQALCELLKTFYWLLLICVFKSFALQVIFKVAEPRDQDATAIRPVSKGPSVNVARQRLPEVTEEASDIVRPIGDVRSFQHQVTKGRYDRWELYCVAWVSCEARAQVTSPRFDSYQMMKATLRADKKNMLIERILLCPGHTLLHWDVNCFLLIFFVHIFDNIFINSEIRRMWSNKRPPPWLGTQPDFNHYQWYYSYYVWWQPQDTCNSVTVILVP